MRRKTALITGASRGLGKSLALVFSSNGYNIILHGRDEGRLNSVRQEVLKSKVDCYVVIGDITEEQTIINLTNCAEKADIDILINNAGVYFQKPVDETSPYELKNLLNVNLLSPILLTKGIFEIFKKKSSGLIININSVAGKSFGQLESAYCASKHGLRGFMGSFQFEALKYNVPIINIYSGAMSTDMTAERGDTEKFIRTEEAARFIFEMSRDYSSMRISEIDIFRKIY
ncbi:MAG: SDR family NAD(P)-dependent oxidoreductase [Nitrospirae bacterium]|nr:SDR family NAD(P)-dependent oxidoreductase [Nitrospirota bacterium]